MFESTRRYATGALREFVVRTAILFSILVSVEFCVDEPKQSPPVGTARRSDWGVSFRNFFG